jgi:hypothetical protein
LLLTRLLSLFVALIIFAGCCGKETNKSSEFLPDLKANLLKDNQKGKLIFTFASLAYTIDSDWGKGVPEQGMERIARVAHKYNIPVTWLIDPGSGKVMKNKIDEWHKSFGDDIALVWGHSHATPTAYRNPQVALDSLRILFPWAAVKVAASGTRSNVMFAEIKRAGLSGVWGSCWEQVGIDRITDRGAPWGYFYAAADNFKLPALTGDGLVSVEWTTRDLLKSLHSSAPTIYSSDPDDVGRTDLCTGDDIEYWKAFFDNYIRNIAHNEVVFFPQHQEAHEMEYSDVCRAYSPEEIEKSQKMLDAFFAYVKSYGEMVDFMTIPEAVRYYKENFRETEPSVMLFDDAPARKPPFWYGAYSNRAAGPWPKTLLFYDKECQLAFIEDQFKPILHRDYTQTRAVDDPDYYEVFYTPQVKIKTPWEPVEFTEIHIEIVSQKAMPYALTLWYDFSRFRIDHIDGAHFFGPIEKQVVLLRIDLKKGLNKIFVQLARI